MTDIANWDWETKEKLVSDLNEWKTSYEWVEEPYVSPDGEKIAAIVNTDEAEFNVCENSKAWEIEEPFEKAYSLRYSPDGRLIALTAADDEWKPVVDGKPWETIFDFVWDLKFSKDGKAIAVATQTDGEYCMAVNDVSWEDTYSFITCMILSDEKNQPQWFRPLIWARQKFLSSSKELSLPL